MKTSGGKPTLNQFQLSSDETYCDGMATCLGRKGIEETTNKMITVYIYVDAGRDKQGRPNTIWLDNIRENIKEYIKTEEVAENISV